MARYATSAEATVLSGVLYQVALQVQVANGDGALVDRTSWVETVEVDQDVDQPVAEATIEFRRDAGVLSLSPLRTDSTLNRNAVNAYAPALNAGRLVVISLATTALGVAPVASDYHELFRGKLDKVQWAKTPLVVTARDLGAAYVGRWVEAETTYGSTAGVALEAVVQAIINDWGDDRTLSVPVSPAYAISPAYKQSVSTVMDALQQLSGLRGWDVRDKWDQGSSTWRPTLFGPDRTKTTPDFIVAKSRYIDVTEMEIDPLTVRNAIAVEYSNAPGTRAVVGATDADSVGEFGRQFMRDAEPSDSPINTAAEAQTLANVMLADLKDPKASHTIEMHIDWRVELGDLLRFTANGIHYDTDQDLAVVSIRHKLSRTSHRTIVATRGKPAARYLGWIARANEPVNDSLVTLYNQCVASIVSSTATQVTVQVTASAPSGAVPTVQLVNVTGSATLLSGPAPGVQCASGQQWTFSRGASTGGPGQAQFEADFAGNISDTDLATIPEQQGAGVTYTQCNARITASDATTETITVTGTAPSGTPTVQLVGTTGSAALISGPAAGAASPSGSVWVFARGAALGGDGQAQFRAVLAGTQSDDDFVSVPEQGRDTFPLAMRARVTATTPTTVTVRAAVADPYPQGSGSAVMAYQALGTGTVTPASGGAVTPQSTLTEAAGTYVDYVIARPSFGSGTGRVTFTSTAANRISDSDAVDVPEQMRDTTYLASRAKVIATSATTVTVRYAVADPYPQGSGSVAIAYQALGTGAVTPASGGTVTPQSTLTEASGTYIDYVITRGAFATGTGRVTFTATAANRVSDSDAVDIPAQEKTQFGPNLQVGGRQSGTNYIITWSGDGVTLQIDNGTSGAPPASPITVAMNAPGGAAQTYTFTGTKDNQTFSTVVNVPAQSGSTLGTDALTPLLTTDQVDDSATLVTITATCTNLPGAYTWAIYRGNSDGRYDATALQSGSNSTRPLSGSGYSFTLGAPAKLAAWLKLVVTAFGQQYSTETSVIPRVPAINQSGAINRGVPFSDGYYAGAATSAEGYALHGAVRDSRGSPVNNMFRYGGDDAGGVNPTAARSFISGSYVDSSNRPTSVYRNAVNTPAGSLFQNMDSADNISPSTARSFIAPSYVNSTYAPIAINRNGALDSTNNLFRNGDSANSVGASSTRSFIAPAFINGTFQPISIYRNGSNTASGNLFQNMDAADQVSPSSTRSFVSPSYIDSTFRPISVYRGTAIVPVSNLFQNGDSAANITSTATNDFINTSYVDATNRPISVYRGTAAVPVTNLFQNGDSANNVGASTTRTFVAPAYVNSSLQPINVQRAGSMTSVDNVALLNSSAVYPSQFQGGYVDASLTFRTALYVQRNSVAMDSEVFTAVGRTDVPHYGIKWDTTSYDSATPAMMLGGFAGICFFTGGAERMHIATGGAVTAAGVDMAKVIIQTAALNTTDPAPASGVGTIKLQVS